MGCVSSKLESSGSGATQRESLKIEAGNDTTLPVTVEGLKNTSYDTTTSTASNLNDGVRESEPGHLWETVDLGADPSIARNLTLRNPSNQKRQIRSMSVSETRPTLPSLNTDTTHNGRNMELHMLRHHGELPEVMSQSRKERPMNPSTSTDYKTLGKLMDPEERISEITVHLRNALSDHSHMSLKIAAECELQGVDLEKKLSAAETGKEHEMNKSLREFKDCSLSRASERRMSINPNRVSLHVIPELQDEPTDPETYQYAETNVYF